MQTISNPEMLYFIGCRSSNGLPNPNFYKLPGSRIAVFYQAPLLVSLSREGKRKGRGQEEERNKQGRRKEVERKKKQEESKRKDEMKRKGGGVEEEGKRNRRGKEEERKRN